MAQTVYLLLRGGIGHGESMDVEALYGAKETAVAAANAYMEEDMLRHTNPQKDHWRQITEMEWHYIWYEYNRRTGEIKKEYEFPNEVIRIEEREVL